MIGKVPKETPPALVPGSVARLQDLQLLSAHWGFVPGEMAKHLLAHGNDHAVEGARLTRGYMFGVFCGIPILPFMLPENAAANTCRSKYGHNAISSF